MKFSRARRILEQDVKGLVLTDYVATSVPSKMVNSLLKQLSAAAPFKELPHLKRVRRDPASPTPDHLQVLICQPDQSQSNTADPVPAFVRDILEQHSLSTYTVQVPKHQPLTRLQWQDWSAIWPISWRVPDASITPSSDDVSDGDQALWEGWMHVCFQKAKTQGQVNYALVVDPATGQLIAEGFDSSNANPLHHPVMVCLAAAAQRDLELWPDAAAVLPRMEGCGQKRTSDNGDAEVAGADGKRQKLDASYVPAPQVAPTVTHLAAKPYLCTGFDCIVIAEPCIMCAMGLVHSRVRRVIYCHADEQHGAICSKYKLHSLKSLNHHYSVYHLPLQSPVTE